MNLQWKCIISFGSYIVNMIFFFVAFGAPHWLSHSRRVEDIRIEYYSGLWKSCYEIPGVGKECESIDLGSSPAWFQATVALMIIALIAGVAAGGTKMYMPVSAGLEIFAGACNVLAVVIYGTKSLSIVGDIGYAYVLSICCCFGFLTNGITLLCFARRNGCDMTNQLSYCCERETVVDTV